MADLPNGPFSGYDNPDGTNTLYFPETNQTFTCTPLLVPASIISHVDKRAWMAMHDCREGGPLNTREVDKTIALLEDHLNDVRSIGVGQYSDWSPYYRYNFDGVYSYFCANTNGGHYWYADRSDLDLAIHEMDFYCGPYVAGCYAVGNDEETLFKLWGTCRSGIPVCLDDSRSPR